MSGKQDGCPLAYRIHEGDKHEGHAMLPVVTEFVRKYNLESFIAAADPGLMNNGNTAGLEANGCKCIIGAKIKSKSKIIRERILGQPKKDCQTVEYDKGNGRRLFAGCKEKRARKDSCNRKKGIRRLEKAYSRGRLTKDNINKRGCNKFLKMDGDAKASVNYDRIEADAKRDGLKGYDRYRHSGGGSLYGISQSMARREGLPDSKIQD